MRKNLFLVFLLFTFLLVGCSSKSDIKDVPVSEIKDAILKNNLLDVDPLNDIPASEFHALSSVKNDINEGFMLSAMINVKLRDVIVIKTDNPEVIINALEKYKNNSLKLFADGYGGEDNMESVSNSILKTIGNYVYFIAN
ncbi:lipoprotein [Paraclostridium bifermentans]|uniref:DUF4358 domain-containing protein n=1 Tax=Paraclostridium bifermentans TaxID=1490 RepID=UPI0021C310A7|nr:DUF4358 domain-containing protein [Paraclostridium bifermentans]GKZ10658.1 lipoprotein [Paraclostridium bifermentans]